jgi:dimethylglycine dehydrogenase
VVGNLRMAQTQARMDEYMLYASTAETVGIPFEWLTPDQIKARWPLVRTEDLKGAIYHPTDGYINPADVTMAMAKGARQRGVVIERKWQVDGYAGPAITGTSPARRWWKRAATSSPPTSGS